MKKILTKVIIFSLIAIILTSCNREKIILEESISLKDNKWLRQEPISFNVPINNAEDCYDIYCTMEIDTTSIRGKNFPLIVNIWGENGERRMFYSYLFLKNDNGTWLAPLEGSKLIINQKIKKYFFFNKEGKYRLEIGQGTDRYEIDQVTSFGVKIQKVELEYPE